MLNEYCITVTRSQLRDRFFLCRRLATVCAFGALHNSASDDDDDVDLLSIIGHRTEKTTGVSQPIEPGSSHDLRVPLDTHRARAPCASYFQPCAILSIPSINGATLQNIVSSWYIVVVAEQRLIAARTLLINCKHYISSFLDACVIC